MIVGCMYTDAMDRTRKVCPLDDKGNCAVYFHGMFAGKVKLSPRLFSVSGSERDPVSRYGFVAQSD